MNINDIQAVLGSHTNYWTAQRKQMSEYTKAYQGQMFRDWRNYKYGDTVIINTSDCYAYVESFIASLFSKAPAVAVGPDATNRGNPRVVEALVNRFLYEEYTTMESGLRYGLLYPAAYFKLGICERPLAVDSIEIRAVHPWDVIVDMEAIKWEKQRFVGHRYWLPIEDAKKMWPGRSWSSAVKEDYLVVTSTKDNTTQSYATLVSGGNTRKQDGSTMLTFVEVIEFYDLVNDQLIFYSPSLKTNDGLLETVSPIPYRAHDGAPLPPIACLYLGTDPHIPLKGMSAVGRVYDQLYEINQLRTVWANGVRKDARIFMARKGVIDGEAKSQLAANIDNSVIEIDLPADKNLSEALMPVPHATYSTDYGIYKAEVRADLDRGSILAPFTRGVATNATATEISALTQYSASEIGKLARARDATIEQISKIYVSMLHFLIDTADDETPEIIFIEGKPVPLVATDFEGKFKFAASDQSSTPFSSAIKKQRFMEAVPMLMSLGVDKKKLLEEFIKEWDLPPGLALPGAEEGAQLAPQEAPAEIGALPVGGGTVASDIRSGG